MKHILFTICLIATVAATQAQTSYRKFLPVNNGYSNSAIDAKRANDGGYLILELRQDDATSKSNVLVTKYNQKGDSLWSSGLNGNQLSGGAALDVYPNDGSMFVGFQYQVGSNSNTAVGHLDKDGTLIGGSAHTFDLSDWEDISSLTQTDDGGFVMTVNAAVQNGSYMGWIVKVKNDFSVEWQKVDSSYTFNKVIKQALGSYVCVGTKATGGCKMVKYSSVGNKLWEQTWASGELYDVCEVANNDLVAVGYGASFQAVKVSNTGVEQWKKNYYGTGTPVLYPTFYGVTKSIDGQLIFAGNNNNGTKMDYFLVKADNSGSLQWTRSFGSYNQNGNTHFSSVEKGGFDGYILVASYDRDNNGFNDQAAFYKTDDKGQVANLSVFVTNAVVGKPIIFDDGKGGQGSITFTKLGNVKNIIISVYGDSMVFNGPTLYTCIKRFINVEVFGATGYEAALQFIFTDDERNGTTASNLSFLHYVASLASWESFIPSSITNIGNSVVADLNKVTSFSPWTMGELNTGIEDELESNNGATTIYPVPASNQLNITHRFEGSGLVQIELLDMTGRIVKVLHSGKSTIGKQSFDIDIAGIKSGIYLCRINEDSKSSTAKIIIE